MAQFDTEEIVIGGTEWITAPFRFNRMLVLGGSGESYIDVLLSGVSPLALTNALGLNYIKALGATEQSSTPTPDNPVDIVCNNGVLKIKNLFDKSIFVNDTDQNLTYTAYQVPNGTYTMSSPDYLLVSSATNIFFLAGNVSSGASSSNNGVAQDKPITITVTDGYYTVAHRYRSSSNNNHPIDFNWQIEQGSTATSYIPYGQVYADGTTEMVNITGKNLFDKNAILENVRFSNTTGYEYGTTGDVVAQVGRFVSDLVPVQVGSTYTKNTNADAFHRVKTYNSNKICLRYIDNTNIITIQQDEAYIVISGYLTEIDNTQLELGSIATDYEPYFNGGTANAEMLLKVDDYKDNQELLTGNITRNVGIKVLDGTENWKRYSTATHDGGYLYYSDKAIIGNSLNTPASKVLSTHFIGVDKVSGGDFVNGEMRFQIISSTGFAFSNRIYLASSYTSLSDFIQWLADQYNAGTPVILVYPLATPTTETVTGQSLTASSNCTVTATGSLNNLELELSYKQSI